MRDRGSEEEALGLKYNYCLSLKRAVLGTYTVKGGELYVRGEKWG